MVPAKVVMGGRTQSGKSTLCNNLVQQKCFEEGNGLVSKTKRCSAATARDHAWHFVDVMGQDDCDESAADQQKSILGFAPMAPEGVTAFIYVVRGAWDASVQANLKKMKDMIGKDGCDRTLLVQTGVEGDKEEFAATMRGEKVIQPWLAQFAGVVCVDNKDFSGKDRERIFSALGKIKDTYKDKWSNHILEEMLAWQNEASTEIGKLSENLRKAPAGKLEAWTSGRATRDEVDSLIKEAQRQQREQDDKEKRLKEAEETARRLAEENATMRERERENERQANPITMNIKPGEGRGFVDHFALLYVAVRREELDFYGTNYTVTVNVCRPCILYITNEGGDTVKMRIPDPDYVHTVDYYSDWPAIRMIRVA